MVPLGKASSGNGPLRRQAPVRATKHIKEGIRQGPGNLGLENSGYENRSVDPDLMLQSDQA